VRYVTGSRVPLNLFPYMPSDILAPACWEPALRLTFIQGVEPMKRYWRGLGIVLVVLAFWSCQSTEMTSAKVYLQQKNLDKAEENLLKAIQNEPQNSEAPFLLASEVYVKKGEWAKAAEYFAKSLAINNKFAKKIEIVRDKYWVDNFNNGAKIYNGMLKDKSQITDEAIEQAAKYFQACIILNPNKPEAYSTISKLYLLNKDYDKAVEYLKKAIEHNPKDISSLINLGSIYFQKGELEKSQEMLQKALEVDPGNVNAIKQVAVIYDKMGKEEEAIAAYGDALKADPQNPDLHYNLGVLYFNRKDYKKAASEFVKTTEITPDASDAYYNAGLAYLEIKDLKNAEKYLSKALELEPNSLDTLRQLRLVYYQRYGIKSAKFKEISKKLKELESK